LKKYPDNVVYNYNLHKFDASLKPYPTDLGAPPFNNQLTIGEQAKSRFKSRIESIQSQWLDLCKDWEIHHMVSAAECSFAPDVGGVYHLYKRNDGSIWLSIISPAHWKLDKYIGSYRLNHDGCWYEYR